MDAGRTARIARMNDTFRREGFGFVVTPGIRAVEDMNGLLQTVRQFDGFTEDNDPYGEHDFGAIEWHGTKVFWNIDYYDKALEFGEEPLSPDCRRVMTVLLADEY
jgi:hypothetical protein